MRIAWVLKNNNRYLINRWADKADPFTNDICKACLFDVRGDAISEQDRSEIVVKVKIIVEEIK